MQKFAQSDERPDMVPELIKEKVLIKSFYGKMKQDDPIAYLIEGVELDFTSCTLVDLIRLASKHVIIQVQAKMRKAGGDPMDAPEKWERTWNVKDEIVNAERSKADPVAKANAAFAAISDAEREAIIQAHIAKMAASK